MIERMKALVEELNRAAKVYYQDNDEMMSNEKYDKLYDELVVLEKKSGIILSNSPTQKVGYEVMSSLQKVAHEHPILSLDKTKELSKLQSFLGDKKGLLSWKLDGLTIVLRYNEGKLVQAITRGNGEVGEDVTHNAKVFSNLPITIPFLGEVVLRGEGVIPYSEFYRINEGLDEENAYKNPRNLGSGTVRQLNSEIAAQRNVQFLAFTLVSAEGKELSDSKEENMQWLAALGFATVHSIAVTQATVEDAVAWFKQRIVDNDIASDGLVLTYDSISYSQSLGRTAKFPKDSIAFKWADEMAETMITEIVWNTSRTGLMNPIAVFEPVELEGSTVSRASVHNVSILRELGLTKGSRVKVYKANMIIPQIAENLTPSEAVEIPTNCFVCGKETQLRKIKDGEVLYCTNPSCKAQRVQKLSHFVSRDAMNIEGLSEETLKKFLDQGYIDQYPDIFRLSQYKEQIAALEGFGEKSYKNLIDSIEKSKVVGLPNFIYALGIDQIGLRNAKLLCANYEYDLEQIKKATQEELLTIDGFGSVIANSVSAYFADEEHLRLLDDVLGYISFIDDVPKISENTAIAGKTFVVTGEVSHFANRKELSELIEQNGGKITGSVTKKTNYLINNDLDSPSSKNQKAKALGIPIIKEEEFIKQFLKEDTE